MAEATEKQDKMAVAAALHMGAAASGLLALMVDRDQQIAKVRATFIEAAGEIFDEVAGGLGLG